MNQLTGFNKEKMVEDLKGVIYRIPDIDDNNEVYITADEYLSGNIRQKLKVAEMALSINPIYQENIDALKQAMPDELSASEIEVRLGATWIPENIYEDFMHELLSTSTFIQSRINITYSKATGNWNISNKNWDRGNAKAEKHMGHIELMPIASLKIV